ncbi:MAG: asparagine synthase (glutamine-hydrolyzing) [Methyloceanibacter sp.]|uniref:asparagine synthase (glutamine-hydrolyzing) n=1 Tax=Methyloceanibacter sp. TaxID=1965321 RepID=UPI003EDED212
MCGVAGVVDLKGRRKPDQATLERMAAALTHRGPDDDGFLVASGIGLANRRLSIVGVSDGAQPIFNEDQSVAVVCNGELFEFPEWRAELEAKGHVFRTHSDVEIIVHLYEEYGEGFIGRLTGQFAFALVDFKRRSVLLARDRVGICPLFWSRQGDFLYFGSEIKALLASGTVTPKADPRGLDHLFTFFALGGRRTVFDGVQALAPGHCLKIAWGRDDKAATPVETKYWDFDFPDWGEEDDPADEEAGIDAFEEAFARAVEIRLRADVPVVGYLSGGVDSAYVLATAAHVSGKPLPSFTLRVPDPRLDETTQALEASGAIGGLSTVVDAGAGIITDNYAALTTAAECPVLDTSCAALLALSREVRAQGYKVVLTGEGADEAFAGYVWYKIREIARRLDIGDAFRPSTVISRAARKWAARDQSFAELARIDGMIGGPHAQSILYNLVARSRGRYYSAGMKEELGSHVAYEDLDFDTQRMARWHPLNRSLYLGYKVHLPGLLLGSKGDRVAMANSVETRYPFLDENVIALAARTHPRWKLRPMLKDKYLLRQAALRRLPRDVALRPKNMFRAPTAETFLIDPPAFVRDLLSPESLARTGYFDVEAVERDCALVARAEGDKLGVFDSLGLGGVVATQLWHHLYLGGDLCELPNLDYAPKAAPPARQPRALAGGAAAP